VMSAPLHLVPRLRMSGAVPLLPLCALMEWTGTTLRFHHVLLISVIFCTLCDLMVSVEPHDSVNMKLCEEFICICNVHRTFLGTTAHFSNLYPSTDFDRVIT
jgi:hypothetical protein